MTLLSIFMFGAVADDSDDNVNLHVVANDPPKFTNFELTRELGRLFPGYLISVSMDAKSGEIYLDGNGRKLKVTWQPKKDWAQLKSNTSARDAIEDLEKQLGGGYGY